MRISPAFARLSRPFLLLSTALVVLALAAGCRGTQVAYQFRPATPLTTATIAATDTVAKPAPTAGIAVASAPALPAHGKLTKAKLRPARQMRQLRRVVGQALAQQRPGATASRAATQSARHAARPQKTTEVGLGTTVLGVLGLIVLPISLLGLLIWGGPVWAILAGLAALAVLVAYLDPFG